MQETSSVNTETETDLSEMDKDCAVPAQPPTPNKPQGLGFTANQFWEHQRQNRLPVCTG